MKRRVVLVIAALALAWGRKQGPGSTFLIFLTGFTGARWLIFYLRAGQSPLEMVFYPLLYATIVTGAAAALLRTRKVPRSPANSTGLFRRTPG